MVPIWSPIWFQYGPIWSFTADALGKSYSTWTKKLLLSTNFCPFHAQTTAFSLDFTQILHYSFQSMNPHTTEVSIFEPQTFLSFTIFNTRPVEPLKILILNPGCPPHSAKVLVAPFKISNALYNPFLYWVTFDHCLVSWYNLNGMSRWNPLLSAVYSIDPNHWIPKITQMSLFDHLSS